MIKADFKTFIIGLMFTVVMASWSSASFAQDKGSQMGLLYGYTVPDAENTNPHGLYGVKGSAFIFPGLTLGGYYFLSGSEEGPAGVKFDYSQHGIEGDIRMAGGAGGETFFGLRIGMTKVRTQQGATDLIFSPYHYGVVVGHDFILFPWLSFGFEGSYIHVQESRTTLSGTNYHEDSFNLMGFLVALQFRL